MSRRPGGEFHGRLKDILTFAWIMAAAAIAIGLLDRIPRDPGPSVNEAASKVTRKAGEHFTRGAIDAIKDEFGGER